MRMEREKTEKGKRKREENIKKQAQFKAAKETAEEKHNPHKKTKRCLAYDVMMMS